MLAGISLLAQEFPNPDISVLKRYNKSLKIWRKCNHQTMKFVSLGSDEEIRFHVSTDAAWANAPSGGSQAGFVLMATQGSLNDNKCHKVNVISWDSGRLRRVCPSTLAAETQALNKGADEMIFTNAAWSEICDPDFRLEEWLSHGGDITEGNIITTDCKSAHDGMVRGHSFPSDKRCALETVCLRRTCAEYNLTLRWVSTKEMTSDVMTKFHEHGR